MEYEIAFFEDLNGKYYCIYVEDLLSHFDEISEDVLSQGYKIIEFLPVRNKFGDDESEYKEDSMTADCHHDDGNEVSECPRSDTNLTDEEYKRDAALAEKRIEKEKAFQEWRVNYIFESSGDLLGLNTYLQYFTIALVKK